jgi:hypothetical protein
MSGSRVIKGEPSATDAALLRRSLTDGQKAELRVRLRHLLGRHVAAVLNPPNEDTNGSR